MMNSDVVEIATVQLVRDGAILKTFDRAIETHLVGELRWLGPGTIFWFAAHGDRVDDGHVVEFDRIEMRSSRRFHFHRHGRFIAQLSAIECTEVDDPDDYRIAFQLWPATKPRTQRLIDQSLERWLAQRSGDENVASRNLPPPSLKPPPAAVIAIT